MILHSYSSSMPWVQGLERGVDSVFKDKRYIDIRSFYMNSKFKHDKAYLKRRSKEAIDLIRRYKPDVLIVFDTDAQQWVVNKLMGKYDGAMVLAGVISTSDLKVFENAPNITGIVEKIPVKVVMETLSLMLPNKNRIYYLSDNSTPAKQLECDIANENWNTFNLVAHKRVQTLAQWKRSILEAQDKSDVILLSTYHVIFDHGKQVPSLKLIQWTLDNSKIPVIGLYESFINDGGYLAIAVASAEQGYTAAKMAMFLLDNKAKIEKMPFTQSQTFQLQLRKRLIKEHYSDIIIPSLLEAFSKTKWQLDDLSLHTSQVPQKRRNN